MTETLVAMEPQEEPVVPPAFAGDPVPMPEAPEQGVVLTAGETELLRVLVRCSRDAGADLTGPGGLLKHLSKTVIESALEEELVDHLGYDKYDPAGRNHGNSRNGHRSKTIVTDACGEVIEPGGIRSEWGGIAAQGLRSTSGQGAYAAQADAVATTLAGEGNARFSSDPTVIADAILKAVNAKRPKTRDAVGFGAKPLIALHDILPDRGFDALIKRASGVQ